MQTTAIDTDGEKDSDFASAKILTSTLCKKSLCFFWQNFWQVCGSNLLLIYYYYLLLPARKWQARLDEKHILLKTITTMIKRPIEKH